MGGVLDTVRNTLKTVSYLMYNKYNRETILIDSNAAETLAAIAANGNIVEISRTSLTLLSDAAAADEDLSYMARKTIDAVDAFEKIMTLNPTIHREFAKELRRIALSRDILHMTAASLVLLAYYIETEMLRQKYSDIDITVDDVIGDIFRVFEELHRGIRYRDAYDYDDDP